MKPYQDIWEDGEVVQSGYRECAERYAVVREFCERFDGSFTVCDIGANQGYFGLRLVEDFPQCSVIAFEFTHFDVRARSIRKSPHADRIMFCNRKVSLSDIKVMSAFGKCDVVLVLSVLHHVRGSFDAWLRALRGLGQNVLAELAIDDSRATALPEGYGVPEGATVLGYGDSHLWKDAKRPILWIRGDE